MAKPSPSNPLGYIVSREYVKKSGFSKRLIRERLNCARSLFRKDLLAHYGCVNAIEFSNRGDLLVSGGDDRRVLIWNVEQAVYGVAKTVAMRSQHTSNIFCLGFDSTNHKVFSAGNDDQVIVHDAVTGEAVNFFIHEQPVYGLSIDPLNDNVFASACDDGRVLIYDIREPTNSEPFCLARYKSSFHAVMFNPLEPRILTTANSKEGVGLWDVRRPIQLLMKYGNHTISQSCMSVRFNHTGSHILALRRRLPPVLYAIQSPDHLCQFDHPGYYNSCTMKSCCFAGANDEYVLSGSDDFGLYVWKIPSSEEKDQWVEGAHMVLHGHRSIVNQVRYNPSNCIIASSGVEKLIKFWSPFALPESSGSLLKEVESSDGQRQVFTHEEYISLVMRSGEFMTHDYSHKSTKEDPRMMAFFDSLVQREIEGWTTDQSASTEISAHDVPGSASDSDSALSDAPVTAITAALVEALEEQGSSADHSTEPNEENDSQPTDAQNRISQLIARKRSQLIRLARSRTGEEVETIRSPRSRKTCLVEHSSDSSDNSKSASSHKKSTGVEDGCESDQRNGKPSSSQNKYFTYKRNGDAWKRRMKYYSSDSSEDEDWNSQQKKKRKFENCPSDSNNSDISDVDKVATSKEKCSLNNEGQTLLEKNGNITDTSSSDEEERKFPLSSKSKLNLPCKTGKLINPRSLRRQPSKSRIKKSQKQKLWSEKMHANNDVSDSGDNSDPCINNNNNNDETVPSDLLQKEALVGSLENVNDQPNLPVTPNHSSSSVTLFQEMETPDSGIASTNSPFSRPCSNNSHRSISPQSKSFDVDISAFSVADQSCSSDSIQVESPHNCMNGSSISVEMPTSFDSTSRNPPGFSLSENRGNSDWMVFQRFRNRVNKVRRNFRKHISDDSDSN